MRNALVKEAIDFSEAVQRASPAEAFPAAAPEAPRRATGTTRVVSVASQAELDVARAETRRRTRLVVALAVVAALTGAYHAYDWSRRRSGLDDRPQRSGTPAGAIVAAPPTPFAPVVVRSKDGAPFTDEEVKRMRDEEALKGNEVREPVPGSFVILPARGAPRGAEGAPEAPHAR
jgi:hypothetical protein